jgi:hypothetical protein
LKDAAASPEMVKALATDGHRVVLASGTPLCEVWLMTSLPPAPKDKDAEHTSYSGLLGTGALVGVISFPNGAKDFRGQAIKPGAYSLRYAVMPTDGAHMGAAPQRDFLLAVPLAMESDPTLLRPTAGRDKDGPPSIPLADLLKASSAAAGTNHPAVFLLLPTETKGDLPRAYENPDGYVVFAGKAGGVSLALVVKGQAEQ